MKRDFSNESLLNLYFRLLKFIIVRVRGRIYFLCRFFYSGSGPTFHIGSNSRFINSKGVLLGDNVTLGMNSRIEAYYNDNFSSNKVKIRIGNNSSFGDYLHIGAINGVFIGNGVLGGSNILIIDHNHGVYLNGVNDCFNQPPVDKELSSKGTIIIQDNVWIGDNVVILAGVIIGKGAVIAAGSVVSKNIDSGVIYVKK